MSTSAEKVDTGVSATRWTAAESTSGKRSRLRCLGACRSPGSPRTVLGATTLADGAPASISTPCRLLEYSPALETCTSASRRFPDPASWPAAAVASSVTACAALRARSLSSRLRVSSGRPGGAALIALTANASPASAAVSGSSTFSGQGLSLRCCASDATVSALKVDV